MLGFLCLSKLSKVDELLKTSSTWNLKKVLITIKKVNCIKKPIVLKAVNGPNVFSCCDILIYYFNKVGISKLKQNTNVKII